MKKWVSAILVFVIVVSCMSFSGCGAKTESEQQTPVVSATADDSYTPDSTLRLLMVGNSFCYYYVEELYELLMENPPEGIDAVEIYNLYYSGCNLTQHLCSCIQVSGCYGVSAFCGVDRYAERSSNERI